uniref:Uncharacterized protein n=1 Tax=Anguilla anguilla TaxID=7936 RepID=A0A0E9T7N0_ANGAN
MHLDRLFFWTGNALFFWHINKPFFRASKHVTILSHALISC